MMTFDDILDLIDQVCADDLRVWIDYGWVRPVADGDALVFTETDVARVRLIAECHYDLEVDIELMPLVLSLLDQVYGLRRELAMLTRAVDAQPETVRAEIIRFATAVPGDIDT